MDWLSGGFSINCRPATLNDSTSTIVLNFWCALTKISLCGSRLNGSRTAEVSTSVNNDFYLIPFDPRKELFSTIVCFPCMRRIT